MDAPLYPPPNSTLVLRRDHHWPVAFALLALLALLLAASFALVGWPRLESMSLRYEILRLRTDVDTLRHEAHTLEIELDGWRSPADLAKKASALGLQAPEHTAPEEGP